MISAITPKGRCGSRVGPPPGSARRRTDTVLHPSQCRSPVVQLLEESGVDRYGDAV